MADWWDQNGYTFQPPPAGGYDMPPMPHENVSGTQTTTPGTGPGPYGSPTGGYTGGMFPGGTIGSVFPGISNGTDSYGQPRIITDGGNGTRPIQGTGGSYMGATTPGSGGWTPENPTYDPTKPVTPYTPPAPGAPPPSTGGQGGAPTVNRSDPESVRAYVAYYAQQPGANPSLARDPNYWIQKITSGELGDDPGYYVSKFMTPEGPPAGGGGGGTYGNYPLGGSVAPGAGGTGWTQPFQGLTLDQLRNTPGYQFAQEQGQKAITGSAAARGTLLTGGTMKSLARFGTGLADQTYGDAYGRARNEYLDAYGIDRNNRSDIFNRYFNLSSYGTQNPGA